MTSGPFSHKYICAYSIEESYVIIPVRRECTEFIEKTKGKCLNDQEEDSNTALHLAAQGGHLQIVQLLLEAGADKMARFGFYQLCHFCYWLII